MSPQLLRRLSQFRNGQALVSWDDWQAERTKLTYRNWYGNLLRLFLALQYLERVDY